MPRLRLTAFLLVICFYGLNAQSQSYVFGRSAFAVGGLSLVGTGPNPIATGDFNGDGIVDMVAANSNDNTVSVLLGTPDGTFAPQVTYPTGPVPVGLAVGDFNGDGNLDLAVVDENCAWSGDNFSCGAGTVSILLGNGDGTFQQHIDYAVGTEPLAVVTADFNGDGKLDLAVSNEQDKTVSVLLGRGDGTFPQSASLEGTGLGPGLGIAPGSSNSATETAGGTATYKLSIGGGGLSGTATLACSGAPAGATCSLPSSENVSATTASQFTVTVTTTARSSAAVQRRGSSLGWFWAMALIGMVWLPIGRFRRQAAAILPLVLMTFVASCGGVGGGGGGSGSGGTPAGTYTLTVTATMGSTQQSQTLKLTVN